MTDEPTPSSRRPHLYPVTPEDPPYDPEYDRPTDRRLPAQAAEAEQAVLGAMLLSPATIPTVDALLQPADFYQPNHEHIAAAIFDLHAADKPVDPVTVAGILHRRRQFQTIGGAPYLHTLMAACPLPESAAAYAEPVLEAAQRRLVADLGTRFTKLGYATDDLVTEDLLTHAYEQLDTASTLLIAGTRTTHNRSGLHDLTWILDGQAPEQAPPAWCMRTDGHALFYAGKVNGIFGDPECGKTWVAQTAIVEALTAGQNAAMIDVDHNGAEHTAARLMLLGARPEHLADPARFRYYEPEEADELKAAVRDTTTWAPAVLVVDSLGEVLPMLGVKSVDNDEITTALRLICTPPANAGTCVITIDHLPKSAEARVTGYAIGGTAKKRIMRGSYIRAEMRTQPAPGAIGKITLRIEKDTVGELRKVTPGGYAGTFIIDSRQPHVTTTEISRDDSPITADGTFRPTIVMEQVSRYVEYNDLAATNEIARTLGGKKTTIQTAIDRLVSEGFMSVIPGPNRSKKHHSIAHYRQTEDDQISTNHTPPSTSDGDPDDPIF